MQSVCETQKVKMLLSAYTVLVPFLRDFRYTCAGLDVADLQHCPHRMFADFFYPRFRKEKFSVSVQALKSELNMSNFDHPQSFDLSVATN